MKFFTTAAIIALSLSALAQGNCDTLKFKTIKTNYGDMVGNTFYKIGELDGAVFNMDTISSLIFPSTRVVNISNDTFAFDVIYESIVDFYLYAETGLLLYDHNVSYRLPILSEFLPNDTLEFALVFFNLPDIVNYLKGMGINLEQISYWKIITGVSYTSKDGTYSDSVFYAGADTSIFHVVRGGVGIVSATLNNQIRVYPNPTTGQLTIENGYPISDIRLSDIVGKEISVECRTSNIGNPTTTIDISHLSAGMYFLKIDNKTIKIIKE